MIRSPYGVEARYSQKRQTAWTGYKAHLTETCDPDLPSLITNVDTTDATVTDYEMTPVIHQHLAQRDLLPGEHLVDSGYMTADHLVSSKEQGIDLVGPVADDPSWQAQAREGFVVVIALRVRHLIGHAQERGSAALGRLATPIIALRRRDLCVSGELLHGRDVGTCIKQVRDVAAA